VDCGHIESVFAVINRKSDSFQGRKDERITLIPCVVMWLCTLFAYTHTIRVWECCVVYFLRVLSEPLFCKRKSVPHFLLLIEAPYSGVVGIKNSTTMKKILLVIATVTMVLPGCKKIEDSINALDERISKLEQESIPTIDEQIEAINLSLEALNAVDEALDERIEALESSDESTAEEIAALKSADQAIEAKISELKSYVDDLLKSTKDWVSATFATLEQFNELSSDLASLKALVEAGKVEIAANLATAISNLETTMKAWVGEQLSNYYTIAQVDAKILALQSAMADSSEALMQELVDLQSQLEAAKSELTTAYIKAIEDAITTNNGVVDAKIAGEIAAVNSRIDSEVAAINAKIATLQAQVDKNTEDIAKLLARIQSVSYIPQYNDGKATLKYISGASQVTLNFKVSPTECVEELAKVWERAIKVDAVYTVTRAVSFENMPVLKFETDTENGVISVIASGEGLSKDVLSGTQTASVSLSISDGNNSVTSEYVAMVPQKVDIYQLYVPANQIFYTATSKISGRFDVTELSNSWDESTGEGVITFMWDLSYIRNNALRNNLEIISIAIPNTIEYIGDCAFEYCRNLKSVNIPLSVVQCRFSAFGYCSNLEDVYYEGDLSSWCRISFDGGNWGEMNPLYNGASLYINNSTKLTELVIPADITEVKPYTFVGCNSITSITIGDHVTKIGAMAFKNTTPTSVSVANSVQTIEKYAFSGCSNLETANIPEGLTQISNCMFSSCKKLQSITIPESVQSIGDQAFSYCEALPSITIPGSVTSIGYAAFESCVGLTEVTIPENVTEIGGSLFSHCASLTSVNLPSGMTKIGDHMFSSCGKLESVAIPDKVTVVSSWAFCYCNSLKTITIPAGVTNIGDYTFYDCPKLVEVYLKPTTPPGGGYNTFPNNADLKIYVPSEAYDAYMAIDMWEWGGYKSHMVPMVFE